MPPAVGKRKARPDEVKSPAPTRRKKTEKSKPLAGKALDKVLKEMQQTDGDLSLIQARLHENRREQAAGERKRTKLLARVEKLNVKGLKLAVDIEADSQLEAENQEVLNKLRVWGDAVELVDLPDELLEMIFLYLGYISQQRLVRVCRDWKNALTCGVDHLYMNTASLFATRWDRHGNAMHAFGPVIPVMFGEFLRRAEDTKTAVWKYQNPAVRQITFNGMQRADINTVERYVAAWANRYPNLTKVNITQIVLKSALHMPLAAWMGKRPTVRVAISQSLIKALPQDYRTSKECKKLAGVRYDSYVRVPDLILTTTAEYQRDVEDALWPYPNEQTDWLATHAPSLDPQRVIWAFSRLNIYQYLLFSPAKNMLCEQHPNQLCQHMDGAFYRDEVDGQVRNLLAVLLLIQKTAGAQSPHALQFERFQLIKGRRRLVPKYLQ